MRGVVWCFGAGLPTGLLVLGALGEAPRSAGRVGAAVAVAAVLAWVVARTFDDGSAPAGARWLAALTGALVLPAVSVMANWS